MTPKEKAKELVDKFRMNVLDYGGSGLNTFKAKQCALIAADEGEKSEYNVLAKFKFVRQKYTSAYWNEVKQEIEQL